MSRVQLRVHGDMSVLGDEVSGAVLKAPPAPLRKGARGRGLALTFRKEFGERLQKLLTSRELCGTLSWCSEELEPLGEGGERLKENGMKVFTLSEPRILQEIIMSLSALAYQMINRLAEKSAATDLRYTEIAHAVEAELMRHAFDSTWCGEATICKENLGIQKTPQNIQRIHPIRRGNEKLRS